MITIIITTLLTILSTFTLAILANKYLYTDFTRISTAFKISKLLFVTIGTSSINLLLDDGDVVTFTFDSKGTLTSSLLLK